MPKTHYYKQALEGASFWFATKSIIIYSGSLCATETNDVNRWYIWWITSCKCSGTPYYFFGGGSKFKGE